MGKRALPAVAVDDPDPVAALRATARPGDVLVVVGAAAESRGRRPCAARRRGGLDDGLDRRRRAARRRARPTTCCGSTTPAATAPLRRPPRAAVPRAVGADPRLLRAPRPARAEPTSATGRRVHHLLRRGPPGRGRAAVDGHAVRRCARPGRRDGRHHRSSARSIRATSCSCTPARHRRRRGRRPMTEGTDFLYPFIEGDERDAGALLADLAASASARPRPAPRCGPPRWSLDAATSSPPPPTRWPSAFAAGGRLFTFGNGGSSTDAASLAALFARPPWGSAAAGALPGRGHRRAHRARQRRRLRPRVLPPAHRPRPSPATSPSACRPAATRATCSSPSPRRAARPAHRRPGRLRRRRDGGGAGRGALPRRALRQRPPHPGDAGRARLRALGGGAGRAAAATASWPTTRPPATARPRSSTASRRSAGAGRGSPTTSSPWPTAPAARRRRRSSTRCSSRRSPAASPAPLADAATLTLPTGERLAFTTDSFVVQPLRFPGGSIGHLAVHGTVNDLAVAGRRARRGCRRRS